MTQQGGICGAALGFAGLGVCEPGCEFVHLGGQGSLRQEGRGIESISGDRGQSVSTRSSFVEGMQGVPWVPPAYLLLLLLRLRRLQLHVRQAAPFRTVHHTSLPGAATQPHCVHWLSAACP